jgi:predicted  nucleic acid-binding Zn-ribbon protein
MNLDSRDVNLERYRCAKCGITPKQAQELFTGCNCGHRLFRLHLHPNTPQKPLKNEKQPKSKRDLGFLTIREEQIGIYEINVDKLMQSHTEEESPVVAGNNGVYSIRLEKLNKKAPINR